MYVLKNSQESSSEPAYDTLFQGYGPAASPMAYNRREIRGDREKQDVGRDRRLKVSIDVKKRFFTFFILK